MLSTKPLRIASHLLWFILFALSIIQYKERLFADASYYFFHAINSGCFHVEHGRIVLGLSQILPLIGYYLYLPLKYLMLLGSLGHELYYYLIFLFLLYRIKDGTAAAAILLIHLIGQLWLYYSPMLEICYGAALAVLIYALLRSGKYRDEKYLMLLLLAQWFAMTSHPENFILIAFVLAYDFLNRGFQKRIHLTMAGFLIIGFLIELMTFSEYEVGHAQIIKEGSPAGIANLFDWSYLKPLLMLFFQYYWDLLLLFMVGLFLAIRQGNTRKLLLTIGSVLALILVVNQVALANEFTRYYESMYNPLVTLVVLFALYEFSQINKPVLKQILTLGVLIIAGFRILWIWDMGHDLRKRTDQLDRLTDYAQQMGQSKYIIRDGNFQSKYNNITWANPIETLLYSAADGPEASVTVASESDYYFNKNQKNLQPDEYMFRRFEIVPHTFLNERFFKLDQENYQALNTEGLAVSPDEIKKNIELKVIGETALEAGDTTIIQLELINRGEHKLSSSTREGIYLSYHWYKGGEVYEWDGMRTAMEVDLIGNYVQYIKVAVPAEKGEYSIVPDVVIEGKMWFELSESFPVKVD